MNLKEIRFPIEIKSVNHARSYILQKAYTNDLDSVKIIFELLDCAPADLSGATASIMLYMRDGSFFQDTATISGNTVTYTLTEAQGNHAGVAQAQVIVKKTGIEWASSKEKFEIVAGLETVVATEVMIKDWTMLTAEARAFIDDAEAAEALRVTAEQDRATAETGRTTAETERVNAESARVIAEQERAFLVTNLLPYGDFNDGVTGWTAGSLITNFSVDNNIATFTGAGSIDDTTKWVYSPVITDANKKYYLALFAKYNSDVASLQIGFGSLTNASFTLTDTFAKSSVVFTSNSSNRCILGATLGKSVSVKYVLAINLTDTFGAGNEPTAEQMDYFMSSHENSWFSGSRNISTTKQQIIKNVTLEKDVNANKDRLLNIEKENELIVEEIKKPYESILKNGNFISGTKHWVRTFSTDTITSTDGILYVKALANANYSGVEQQTELAYSTGDKIFVKYKVKVTNSSCLSIRLNYRGTVAGGTTTLKVTNPTKGVDYDISHVFTLNEGSGNIAVGILHYYDTAVSTDGKTMEVTEAIAVNLTKTFGAGNEPTETEMLTLLSLLPSLKSAKLQNERLSSLESNLGDSESNLGDNAIYSRGEWKQAILPEREPTLVMSYDDGHARDYTVTFPVHQAKGVPATFAPIVGNIGKPNYLTETQIREMYHAGCEFGIHSYSHLGLGYYLNGSYKLGLPANAGDTTITFVEHGGEASSQEDWFRRGQSVVGIIEEGNKKETFRMRADGTLVTPLLNSYSLDANITHGDETLLYELEYAKRSLMALGIEVNGICYPAGAHNERVRKLAHRYFDWGRALWYQNEPAITVPNKPVTGVSIVDRCGDGDVMAIGSAEFAVGMTSLTDEQILSMMDMAVAEKGLLSLYSHSTTYLPAERIEWIIDQALARGIKIKTMSEAVKMFGKPSYKGYVDKAESIELSTSMVTGEKATYVVPDGKSLYVNQGVLVRSPDESLWRLSIDDTGNISSTKI